MKIFKNIPEGMELKKNWCSDSFGDYCRSVAISLPLLPG